MTITVKERSVYGNILVYPVCDKAIKFAALLGKSTFNHRELVIIESLGYTITVNKLP